MTQTSKRQNTGTNDLDGNSVEKNAEQQHTNRHVRMNAVMSVRNIPREPFSKHTELSNSSETIHFETLLNQFTVVSDDVAHPSLASLSSMVDVPMFRKVSAEEQQRRVLEDKEEEVEDTSDEMFLKRHNEYLDRMKEKYSVYNNKLKRREN